MSPAHSMRMLRCVVLLATLGLLRPSQCVCPLSGCTLSRSFTSESGNLALSGVPQLLWSARHYAPSGAGCVTNGDRVICTMESVQNVSLISWESSGNSSWQFSLAGRVSLPVVDFTGGIIATDGDTLVGYDGDGNPVGAPIPLYPIRGEVCDLTITPDSIVIIMYKCGFFASYMANGVPYAGVWLNASVNGTEGTFIPLSAQAMDGRRMYVLGGFKPRGGSKEGLPVLLRLYAFDVRDALSEKVVIAWAYDFTLHGTVPYLNASETTCTIVPPQTREVKAEKRLRKSSFGDPPAASIMVRSGVVITAVNFISRSCSTSSHGPLCTEEHAAMTVGVADNGTAYSVLFAETSSGWVRSLGYSDPAVPGTRHSSNEEITFWASTASVLEERDLRGKLVGQVDLSQVLHTECVVPTSEITLLHSNGPRIHPLSQDQTNISAVLILGVASNCTQGSLEPSLLALAVSSAHTARLLWTVPVPDGLPVVGQIATLHTAKGILVAITSSKGVYAYSVGVTHTD